jgi:hypothetical protein
MLVLLSLTGQSSFCFSLPDPAWNNVILLRSFAPINVRSCQGEQIVNELDRAMRNVYKILV